MIKITGANFKEKQLVKKVEKACFKHLGQPDFFLIDMTVVDEDTIRALNKEARGIDKVTDVLSFPCFDKLDLPVSEDDFEPCDYDGKKVLLGSIMIADSALWNKQKSTVIRMRESWDFGLPRFLHILGFDHIDPEDEKVMIAHQKAIMDKAGLKRN